MTACEIDPMTEPPGQKRSFFAKYPIPPGINCLAVAPPGKTFLVLAGFCQSYGPSLLDSAVLSSSTRRRALSHSKSGFIVRRYSRADVQFRKDCLNSPRSIADTNDSKWLWALPAWRRPVGIRAGLKGPILSGYGFHARLLW